MIRRIILWMIDRADEAVCQSAGEEDDLMHLWDCTCDDCYLRKLEAAGHMGGSPSARMAAYVAADERQHYELLGRLESWSR